jgi:ubiquinone biosynthesis protein
VKPGWLLTPGEILRLVHINWILIRHGLDEVILTIHLLRPVRFVYYLFPWNWFRRRDVPRAVRIRCALEDLGPVFVKFGQMLSTRRDLLPDDIADELAKLQDRVPPFPGEQARAIVEEALGRAVGELFAEFEVEPMASASIAQVHAARLHSGEEVVVKVLRPGVEAVIRRDVALMYRVAALAERYWPDGRRLRPREVVAEYEKTILDELDLMREAANASQLRRNFEGSPDLYIPRIYWPYTRQNVMVMERIHGIPIADMEALRAHGVDFKRLSEKGVEIFFTQVFRHNFFHADMHPGNIFIAYDHPEDPQYMAVDFGIVGTLSPEDRRYLAENLVAFFHRDYKRVAELHLESGWVPEGTRVDEFESAIRTVSEPIFQRPIKEISLGQLLLRLFQTARRFNMEIQPQLVLLQKTLLAVEGLGRQLDPDLDLWATAKPFLDRWMSEQIGMRAFVQGMQRQLPRLAERIPETPELAFGVLRKLERGELRVQGEREALEALRREIRAANRRTVWAILAAALAVSAALLWGG